MSKGHKLFEYILKVIFWSQYFKHRLKYRTESKQLLEHTLSTVFPFVASFTTIQASPTDMMTLC